MAFAQDGEETCQGRFNGTGGTGDAWAGMLVTMNGYMGAFKKMKAWYITPWSNLLISLLGNHNPGKARPTCHCTPNVILFNACAMQIVPRDGAKCKRGIPSPPKAPSILAAERHVNSRAITYHRQPRPHRVVLWAPAPHGTVWSRRCGSISPRCCPHPSGPASGTAPC